MIFFRYGEKDTAEAYFMAPWGESMRVEQGDYLVMQYLRGNDEVYRVECAVFEYSYTDSYTDYTTMTYGFGSKRLLLRLWVLPW